MKKFEKAKIFLCLLFIGLLAFLTIDGLYYQHGDILHTYIRGIEDLQLGQDITGGFEVIFHPVGGTATEIQLRSTKEVLQKRLDNLGVQNYDLYWNQDSSSITVRFPRQQQPELGSYERITASLTERAVLTLRDGIATDINGKPTGEILLEERDIETAQAVGDLATGGVNIQLNLTADGQNKFDAAAARLTESGQNISVWLDDQLLSIIYTRSAAVPVITGESGVGSLTAESARALAAKLNAGSLPVELLAGDFWVTSALLGATSLKTLLLALKASFVVLSILMVLLYRLPGATAAVSLAGQLVLTLGAYTGFLAIMQPTVLTLSGLCGILLAMGLGVNTHVSISERIRQELRNGKNLDYAITAGYKGACSTLFEGRIPMVIAALFLLVSFGIVDSVPSRIISDLLGSFHAGAAEAVYSFAFAILAGIVANYIMGVWVSRIMLRSLSKYPALRAPVLYGGEKE